MFTLIVENKYGEQMELTHNDAYVIKSIEGLDPPDNVINTTKNANDDGSIFNSSYASNRVITITLAINSPAEENRINLYKYFKAKSSVRLYYRNGVRDVYIDGYIQRMPIEFFAMKQVVQITILCTRPFFNGSSEAVTSFSNVIDLFEFPFEIEKNFNILPNTMQSQEIDNVQFTVNHDGTVDVVGTSSGYIWTAYVNEGLTLQAGEYVLSGCPEGGTAETFMLQAFSGTSGNPTIIAEDLGGKATFILEEETTIKVRIVINGAVEEIFRPMIFKRSDIEYSTETGNPIVITDGSDNNLVECETEINPIQDLHGYDKPWAGGTGKNKLDASTAVTNTLNGVTFTVVKNDANEVIRIDVTGTASAGTWFTIGTATIEAGTYIFNGYIGGSNVGTKYVNYSGIINVFGSDATYTISETKTTTVTIQIENGAETEFSIYPMVRPSSESAGFEPYSNICPITGYDEVNISVAQEDPEEATVVTVNLGQDVYGGTLNVKTGELTITHGFVTFNGSENWVSVGGDFLQAYQLDTGITNAKQVMGITTISNEYVQTTQASTDMGYRWQTLIGSGRLYVYDNRFLNDLVSFKGFLSSNNMQLCYELETPITVNLDPEEIRMKDGYNEISSDVGDLTIKYIVYSDEDYGYQEYGADGIEFSEIVVNQETNVINGGDIETGAIITMKAEGTVVDPAIYNVDTNEYFILDIEMEEGDVITINTKKKEKSVTLLRDGVKTVIVGNIRYGSTWLQLVPNDNVFIATATTFPENLFVTFSVINQYEGV